MTETTTQVPTGLRAARKEQAEARKQHPAGKALPKPGPAKAPANKAPAAKQADKPASTKLRWVFPEGFENKDKTGQTAVAGDREYALLPDGEAWKATVKQDDKTTTLAEGKFGKCYNAITAHNKAASSGVAA